MSTSAAFSPCCPIPLAEGCQTVLANGRWVSVRNPDGSISLINPVTGATVTPANAAAFCPPGSSQSHVVTIPANTAAFVIPAANLEAWSIRVLTLGVSINVNAGGAVPLALNEVVESSAQDDDLLTDNVVITTDATGSARVAYLTRL